VGITRWYKNPTNIYKPAAQQFLANHLACSKIINLMEDHGVQNHKSQYIYIYDTPIMMISKDQIIYVARIFS
jgi:hypothetical protein